MTSRDSMTVWLPKELYGSVEPFADQRYIWCPMPFDDSLPVEQTSFIHMGGEDEVYGAGGPADFDGSTETLVDATAAPCSPADELDGPTDLSSSETESEKEFPLRKISQNLGRGRRRPRKNLPLRRGNLKSGDDGGRASRKGRSFGVHLGLNLDIEVTLKARIHGDIELSAFDEL